MRRAADIGGGAVAAAVACAAFAVTVVVGACSDSRRVVDSFGAPEAVVVPGDTLAIGVVARLDGGGRFHLPAAARRARWRCAGNVSVDLDAAGGDSQQECSDAEQSVAFVSPASMTVELGTGASLVVLVED